MASQVYLQGYLQLVRRSDYLSISELTCFEGSYEGPWFQTQLIISFAVGVTSFLIFSYCRTRWPLLFAPRTKLKGTFLTQRGTQYDLFYPSAFSPHEAHVHQAFFGWVIPTIRISEFTVLQIVGLDAAVVCSFVCRSMCTFDTLLASQLLQDGVHSILSMLAICCSDLDARKLEGKLCTRLFKTHLHMSSIEQHRHWRRKR